MQKEIEAKGEHLRDLESKRVLRRVLDMLDLGLLLLGWVVRVVLLSLLGDGLCELRASSEVVALHSARKTRRRPTYQRLKDRSADVDTRTHVVVEDEGRDGDEDGDKPENC